MLGDTAVAVHSEDPRWNWAIGKHVRLPLTNRLIPIIADDMLVDPKFGTGVVKVTPAHDPNDYAVWQRHQGKPDQIEILNILTPDGKINENGGPYAGLKRDAARKKVVEDLTAAGLAGEGGAIRNAGRPQRSEQDADRAVFERSVVCEDGPAGGAGAAGGARMGRSSFIPSGMRSSIWRGLGRSGIGRSRGSFGGGIGYRCGRGPERFPPAWRALNCTAAWPWR